MNDLNEIDNKVLRDEMSDEIRERLRSQNSTKRSDKKMSNTMKQDLKRLTQFTSDCNEEMYEPGNAGISARVVGDVLGNILGEEIASDLIEEGTQEFVVILENKGGGSEKFNLATLIALARKADLEKVSIDKETKLAEKTYPPLGMYILVNGEPRKSTGDGDYESSYTSDARLDNVEWEYLPPPAAGPEWAKSWIALSTGEYVFSDTIPEVGENYSSGEEYVFVLNVEERDDYRK